MNSGLRAADLRKYVQQARWKRVRSTEVVSLQSSVRFLRCKSFAFFELGCSNFVKQRIKWIFCKLWWTWNPKGLKQLAHENSAERVLRIHIWIWQIAWWKECWPCKNDWMVHNPTQKWKWHEPIPLKVVYYRRCRFCCGKLWKCNLWICESNSNENKMSLQSCGVWRH